MSSQNRRRRRNYNSYKAEAWEDSPGTTKIIKTEYTEGMVILLIQQNSEQVVSNLRFISRTTNRLTEAQGNSMETAQLKPAEE
jgi:hypothetical protein